MLKNKKIKYTSSNRRLEMWKISLKMINDRPFFGFFPNTFAFKFIPYSWSSKIPAKEKPMLSNPHNQFLDAATKYGIVFVITLLSLFCYLAYNFFSHSLPTPQEKMIIASLIFFYIIEMIFQFPLLTPWNYLLFLMILSYFLIFLPDPPHKEKFSYLVYILPFCLLATSLYSLTFYIGHQSDKPHLAKTSCELLPFNWRICTRASRLLSLTSDFSSAEKSLLRMLEIDPNNYPALSGLSHIYELKGDKQKMCKTLLMYQSLFKLKKTSKDKIIQKSCSN